jgi:hypothetical protein
LTTAFCSYVASFAGVNSCTTGAVASRLIVTDSVVVPPPLVAVQVNVVPTVSSSPMPHHSRSAEDR